MRVRPAVRLLVLCLLLGLGACVRLGFELGGSASGSRPPDSQVTADTLALDATVKPDAPPLDSTKRDSPKTPDAAKPDSAKTPDGAKLVDLPKKLDTSKPDITSSSPCPSGQSPAFVYSSVMQVCSGAVTQCQAASLCAAPGWHLCTAAEFLLLGGKTQASPVKAWLASCVRDGNMATAPTNAICSGTCGPATVGTYLVFGWTCAGADAISGAQYPAGAHVYSSQYRIGTTATPCAYWEVGETFLQRGAVCCQNTS